MSTLASKEIVPVDQKLISDEVRSLTIKAKEYFDKALSDKTQKFYKDDWKIFDTWAASREFVSLPALPETVILFLAHQADTAIQYNKQIIKPKVSTLIRRLAAIKYHHEIRGYISPTKDKRVREVLSGIKRDKGTAVKKKDAATDDLIIKMISHCPNTLQGLRDKTLILLGFAGALRRSELVALTLNDIEFVKEGDKIKGIKIIIRKSKGDQEGKGQEVPILNGKLRVGDIVNEWIVRAGITTGTNKGLLFPGKESKSLHDKTIANIVKKYATKAGLEANDFSGHSLRRGFITTSAAAGKNLFKIMKISRHKKPETVMAYIEDVESFKDHAGEGFL